VRAINLIPAERRTGGSVGLGRSGGGAYVLLGLVAVLALLVFLYSSASRQVKSRNAQAAKITAEAERAQSYAGQLSRYNGLIAESQARTRTVEELMDQRFDWAHAFHELGRVLPKQVSIASLTGTIGAEQGASGKAASTEGGGSATPAGSVPTFTLTGCAGSQTVVAEMLERVRLIDGVKEATLGSSETSTNGSSSGPGTGACPKSAPTFNATITFEPLPPAAPKATTPVSDTSSAAAAGTPETSSGSSK
jgi:Tfp pilus assembly protein PilN